MGLGLFDLNKAKETNFFNYEKDNNFMIFKFSQNENVGNHIARGNFKIEENKKTIIRLVYNGLKRKLIGYDETTVMTFSR